MAKQVKNSDLVQPKLWQETVKETEALITVLGNLEAAFKKVSAEAAKTAKNADPGSAKGIKDINSATETLKKTSIEADKVRAQIAKAEAQRTRAAIAASKQRASQEEKAANKRQKAATDLIKQRKAAEEATKKEADQVIRLTKQKEREAATTAKATARILEQNRAYNKESRTLNELRKRFKDLAVQNKENTREGRKLLRQITFLDAKLKSVDKTVGQSQRNVGNYSSAFKGVGKVLGKAGGLIGIAAAGLTAFAAGVRVSIPLFREFGLVSAKVQAVSGATATEFSALTEQAKELGQTTPFTASNVAQLQLELSKLGFTADKIQQSTGAILNFAIATDSALGDAGRTVAATINSFDLLASDSGNIADVLTKAFSSSALDLEKFDTALGIVGATANIAGVSLEETTAVLGTLVDAGIDASTAATGLRKVLAISANENRNYKDVLAEIVGDTNQLSKANEIFGLTAQSQAATIANNIDKVDELTLSLKNAAGSAEGAANIIGDTLDGDLKKLTSAVQGLILGNNVFAKSIRTIVQGITSLIVALGGFEEEGDKYIRKVREAAEAQKDFEAELKAEQLTLQSLKNRITDLETPQSERIKLIKLVNREYSDYLPNLINEEDSLDQIAQKLDAATTAMLKRQILMQEEKRIAEALSKQIKDRAELLRFQKEDQDKLNEALKTQTLLQELSNELSKQISGDVKVKATFDEKKVVEFSKALESVSTEFKGIGDGDVILRLNRVRDSLDEVTVEVDEAERSLNSLSDVLENTSGDSSIESITDSFDKLLESFGLVRDDLGEGLDNNKGLLSDLEDTDTIAGSIKALSEEISKQKKELQDLQATDAKGIKQKQEKIQGLEDELESILNIQKALKQLSDFEKNQIEEDETNAQTRLNIALKRKDIIEEINQAIFDNDFTAKDEAEKKLKKLDQQVLDNQVLLLNEQLDNLQENGKDRFATEQEFDTAILNKKREIAEAEIKQNGKKNQTLQDQNKELQENIKQGTIDAIDVIDQAFAKSSQNRLDEIDRETAALKTREDALRQAAQNGSELAEENLATNQRLQAEQERIRDEQVKKAQRRELILAGIKAFAENAGEPGAVQKTLTDITILSAALLNLPFLFEGTEDTGTANKSIDSNGGRLAVLHDNERVMTKKQNAMMGGLSNDDVASIVHDHVSPTHFDHAPMVQVQRFESNAEVLQKFDVLAEKLDNLPHRMPRIVDEKFDEKSKVYKTVIKTGNKVENNHRKVKGIWG